MSVTAIENLDILIVEDSATQALLLKDALEGQQLRVRVATDGMDALEQVQARQPDAIISDISMLRMNGFDFCNRLRAEPTFANIPVILLTGLTDPMDVIKSIACGADSFLTKPCEVNFLLSTIRDVISNKQIKKESDPRQRLAFFFNGKHHTLHIDQVQITNLLLSTYLNAIQKNDELEQSYRTLNAIKSSKPGGTVEIALESSLDEVTITVTDAGTGLSTEAQKGLFQSPSSCSQFSSLGEKSASLAGVS